MRSKHVAHFITTINRGGAENHLFDLVQSQVRAGYDVTLYYLKGNGYWKKAYEELGVKPKSLKLSFYGDILPIFKLRKYLKRNRPDLLHLHMPPSEIYGTLASMGLDIPVVISKHNDERFAPLPNKGQALGRFTGDRAQKIICISKAVENYIHKNFPSLKGKTTVIPYGIEVEKYDRVDNESVKSFREKWGLEVDEVVFGFVGRFVSQKSLTTTLKAFSKICRGDKKCKLLLVGDGPEREILESLAKNLKIEDRVVLTGFREDIDVVMKSLDVLVLSSIYEGFGLVLLEAMAASTPVVCSKVSAIPEVVEEGETGFLFSTGDDSEMALFMNKLLDENTREEIGEKAFLRAKNQFSLETTFRATDEVYNSVLRF